jgi:cell division transport system ATP-binding protein
MRRKILTPRLLLYNGVKVATVASRHPNPMIYYDKVTKVYVDGGPAAVHNITLGIDPGEFVSIVGHSGAGKTTLLKMLFAEVNPTEGSVYFGSREIRALSDKELRVLRRNIGTVFQDFRLLPTKTVYENIAFALEVAGKSDDEIASDVPHVLELVGLPDKMWSFPSQLSGGEQQRVAIARAIVNQPDVLIADEPTGNLDPINTHDVVEILKKINDLGTTVLLTTHNKSVVDSVGRRVVTMDQGRIIRDDKSGKYVL